MHRYPGAWHVAFSFFSQNDDGRKEECNLCLLLDEEVYDQLYSSECSETEPFPCRILQGVYCISPKEVILQGESMDLGNTFWQAHFGKNRKTHLGRGLVKPSTEVLRALKTLGRGI